MSDFYDAKETRDPATRQAEQWAALRGQIAHAQANAPYFSETLKGVNAQDIKAPADLARLPVTRKSDLHARQKAMPPLGGLAAAAMAKLKHVYQSPGPIYEPDGFEADHWRFARAMWCAGLRPGDLVLNCFSYHLTPAGMLVESAAHAIGCPVIPGGVGNTELQVQAINDLKPVAYGGTPSFLRILLQKGREMNLDVSSLKKALVGGEALPPSLRKEINDLGCFVLQSYGTADLGLIAYESPAMEGLILDEDVIVEIVRPGTGDLVAEGEVGEVVVTTLRNREYPLIRFATGDLSAIMAGSSPCGRTNTRIKGWMGRADQTTKVKGMFVTPGQIAQVVARHAEIAKARLEVTSENNVDAMVLKVEAKAGLDAAKAAESLQAICKLRGSVEIVASGSLPNDGKVIADLRTYQ
ncbi:phenylacetate--CoA ligase family protein [Ferrovibrio sp.]|uniref:phenylacetate--CoA ligase family protein n=1 Tax=Ferrovibrio sp. TaxID=1917215 RepID=UPI0025B7AE3E|nr:AMP-binding protein [Ferrovibrio sp.]MBX3456005.1 AMP-binding protein [Ferrovibrio sp.]